MAKIERVRNIGIAAHIDAGKTTVTERFLYYSGKIHKTGEVHDGEATTDYEEDEQKRGITITAAATTIEWPPGSGNEIHIIDTPGHVDFTIEVERSLRVLDSAIVVFDASAGVEPQSETVWNQADKFHIPRLAFINKMDKVGADFAAAVDEIEKRLGANPAPIQLPMGAEDSFVGVVDLVAMKALTFTGGLDDKPQIGDIPDDYAEAAATAREFLIERLADADDAIAEKFLEGIEISEKELREALRRATIAVKLVPVLAGTALRNKAVQPLMDAVIDLLPSPIDLPPVRGVNPDNPDEVLERKPRVAEPLAALLFKVIIDEGRKVSFLRIFSGSVKPGEEVYNVRTGKKEKVARLFEIHANKRKRIDKAVAGMIVATAGLKEATTGDTLCDPDQPILLERIDTYEPVISIAIEPETNAEKERLDFSLQKVMDMDPTFRVHEDEETGQTIISGMGELHLDIIVTRLERDYKVKARVGKPQVVYRETISTAAQGSAKFERKLKDSEIFGEASCKIAPRERGTHNHFTSEVNALIPPPDNILEAAMQGLRDAANAGPDGYPLEDVEAVLTSLKFREDAMPLVGVRSAAAEAFRKAVRDASPIKLEPVMEVEVVTPEEHVGSIIGDLNQRGGNIAKMTARGTKSLVEAHVPLRKMFGYMTKLRTLSSGRAQFTMTFHTFDSLRGS